MLAKAPPERSASGLLATWASSQERRRTHGAGGDVARADDVGEDQAAEARVGLARGAGGDGAADLGLVGETESGGSRQCGNKQCGKDYANFVLPREDLPPKNPRMLQKSQR